MKEKPIFQGFSFWPLPKGDEIHQCTFPTHSTEIPVNYTSENLENFKAAKYGEFNSNYQIVVRSKPIAALK